MARFEKTSCSQCGGEFGPGDHGFSHCSTHQILDWVKRDPMAATREIESMRFKLRDLPRPCDLCGEAPATDPLHDETYMRSEVRVCRVCLDAEGERAADRKSEEAA